MKKLDAKGNYIRFPGVTVVCPIHEKNLHFWEMLYDFISESKLITDHFSPLPLESYHMTAINLFAQKLDSDNDWISFIEKQLSFFQKLHEAINALEFELIIHIQTVMVSGIIQLSIELPKDQENKIRKIAEEFHIEEKIPSIFHITLGYQYNSSDLNANHEIKKRIERKLDEIREICSDTVVLRPAALSYFYDITSFIPWRGDDSPFKKFNDTMGENPRPFLR